MSVSSLVLEGLAHWHRWRRERLRGPLGAFYRSGGNENLWRDLPLDSSSLVIDAGGYGGDWTAEIVTRYGCRALVFEPIPAFVETLRKRFGANNRVEIRGVGLAGTSGRANFSMLAEGTSFLRSASPGTAIVQAELVDVRDVFTSLAATRVDCMALNIEGAEYDVLARMSACDLLASVRSFVIQFHDVGNDSQGRRGQARAALTRTHRLVYDFPFVWERWDRRDNQSGAP